MSSFLCADLFESVVDGGMQAERNFALAITLNDGWDKASVRKCMIMEITGLHISSGCGLVSIAVFCEIEFSKARRRS